MAVKAVPGCQLPAFHAAAFHELSFILSTQSIGLRRLFVFRCVVWLSFRRFFRPEDALKNLVHVAQLALEIEGVCEFLL